MVLLIVNSLPINNILFIIYPLGHLSIALMEWVLLGWGIRLWRKSASLAMIILPLLLASLSYDNLILALGNLIGEGGLLESLSKVRFLSHDLIVPLFIVIGVELAHRAGAAWATTVVRVLSWAVALGLAGIDITTNYIGLELVPTHFAGILRYSSANSGLPIITIVVNLFMLLIGIGIWIRLKWSWLFVGTFIALLGNAMPSYIVGTLPGSASEWLMAISLLLTEQQVQLVPNQPPENPKQEDRFMVDSTTPETAIEWEHIIPKDGYTIYQSGGHKQGNFIQVFAPDNPYRDPEGKLRLITYLHGFALCLPKFYEAHLQELAQKGYYVFFPDFQRSRYPDNPEPEQAFKPKTPHLSFWLEILTDVISKGSRFRIEEHFHEEPNKLKVRTLARKLVRPTRFKYLRVSLALVVFILVVKLLFSWFNRRYGQNLITLISTVGVSLWHSPLEWINQAIYITDKAWEKLSENNPNIAQSEFDFYVFGHSLGGLLALSWPFYLKESQQKFLPKQIITADPAPSTDRGIPQIALWILKLFNVPFAAKPITIATTGSKLCDIPVGIMHGADDTIVKPQFWVKRSVWQKKSNFDCIASKQKQIYFSLSNKKDNPPLIAFHNQAVTDTTYFDDALFKHFGGVKKQPNIYNCQYIWRGVDLVVKNQANVNQLLPKFNPPGSPVIITDTLPEKAINFTGIVIAILIGLTLFGLGYWFWHAYLPV